MNSIRLITVDPGHFHAALVQKDMYPEVSKRVNVYAPLGADLLAHLQRIAGFNSRPTNPTMWELDVHAGPDFLKRMLAERPGNVVVLAGNNARKIDYIEASLSAGLNVLADKPWIIDAAHLPRLKNALNTAEQKGLIAYDIMTERHEITSILQRQLVQDRDILGEQLQGSVEEPGVFMESVHYLKKTVAGSPLRRPASFFDIHKQGEGLSDVGTHLVDLVFWILFPDQAIDQELDLQLLAGKRWPTVLSLQDFREVTGEGAFPDYLQPLLENQKLPYFCNNRVSYTVRGVHVTLNVLWDFEAAPGAGDTHLAIVRGSKADIEVRQGKEENYRAELYIVPRADVKSAIDGRMAQLSKLYPGLAVELQTKRWRIVIPDRYRVGHEAHFGEVMKDFLRYLQRKQPMPTWEKPNMLAKYRVTTQGVKLAEAQSVARAQEAGN